MIFRRAGLWDCPSNYSHVYMAGSVHLWLPANTEEETRFIYLVLHPGVLQCTAFSVFKSHPEPHCDVWSKTKHVELDICHRWEEDSKENEVSASVAQKVGRDLAVELMADLSTQWWNRYAKVHKWLALWCIKNTQWYLIDIGSDISTWLGMDLKL